MGLGRVMKVHKALLSPVQVFPCFPWQPSSPECSGACQGGAWTLLVVSGSPAAVASEAQAGEGSHAPSEGKVWRPKHWEEPVDGVNRSVLREEPQGAIWDQIKYACNTGFEGSRTGCFVSIMYI